MINAPAEVHEQDGRPDGSYRVEGSESRIGEPEVREDVRHVERDQKGLAEAREERKHEPEPDVGGISAEETGEVYHRLNGILIKPAPRGKTNGTAGQAAPEVGPVCYADSLTPMYTV